MSVLTPFSYSEYTPAPSDDEHENHKDHLTNVFDLDLFENGFNCDKSVEKKDNTCHSVGFESTSPSFLPPSDVQFFFKTSNDLNNVNDMQLQHTLFDNNSNDLSNSLSTGWMTNYDSIGKIHFSHSDYFDTETVLSINVDGTTNNNVIIGDNSTGDWVAENLSFSYYDTSALGHPDPSIIHSCKSDLRMNNDNVSAMKIEEDGCKTSEPPSVLDETVGSTEDGFLKENTCNTGFLTLSQLHVIGAGNGESNYTSIENENNCDISSNGSLFCGMGDDVENNVGKDNQQHLPSSLFNLSSTIISELPTPAHSPKAPKNLSSYISPSATPTPSMSSACSSPLQSPHLRSSMPFPLRRASSPSPLLLPPDPAQSSVYGRAPGSVGFVGKNCLDYDTDVFGRHVPLSPSFSQTSPSSSAITCSPNSPSPFILGMPASLASVKEESIDATIAQCKNTNTQAPNNSGIKKSLSKKTTLISSKAAAKSKILNSRELYKSNSLSSNTGPANSSLHRSYSSPLCFSSTLNNSFLGNYYDTSPMNNGNQVVIDFEGVLDESIINDNSSQFGTSDTLDLFNFGEIANGDDFSDATANVNTANHSIGNNSCKSKKGNNGNNGNDSEEEEIDVVTISEEVKHRKNYRQPKKRFSSSSSLSFPLAPPFHPHSQQQDVVCNNNHSDHSDSSVSKSPGFYKRNADSRAGSATNYVKKSSTSLIVNTMATKSQNLVPKGNSSRVSNTASDGKKKPKVIYNDSKVTNNNNNIDINNSYSSNDNNENSDNSNNNNNKSINNKTYQNAFTFGNKIGRDSSGVEKRAIHNTLERKRRDDLKSYFSNLREHVPDLENKPKAAKVIILTKATEYLAKLNSAHENAIVMKKHELIRRNLLKERLKVLQLQL